MQATEVANDPDHQTHEGEVEEVETVAGTIDLLTTDLAFVCKTIIALRGRLLPAASVCETPTVVVVTWTAAAIDTIYREEAALDRHMAGEVGTETEAEPHLAEASMLMLIFLSHVVTQEMFQKCNSSLLMKSTRRSPSCFHGRFLLTHDQKFCCVCCERIQR